MPQGAYRAPAKVAQRVLWEEEEQASKPCPDKKRGRRNLPCSDEIKAKRKLDKVFRCIHFLELFADEVAHDPLIIIPEPAAEEGHAPAVHGVFGNKDAEADLVARL